jgi:hypothetical protein
MDYFQYSIKDDARAKEIKDLLENNIQLLNFLMSLLDLADEYITEMYDLSSESDIEEDDPDDPNYSTESDEDDY